MMMPPLFLDVNVPMYAAGQKHPYRDACAWVMTEVVERRLSVAIDTEIIQEVLYRYGSLGRWKLASQMATDLIEIVPTIYPVLAADMLKVVQLFKEYAPQGVTARDCIHVAVMENNGLTEIISTDRHFDQVAGIHRLDPQKLFDSQQI